MSTKLDRKFAATTLDSVRALANEVERLECYCAALEARLTEKQIMEASCEGATNWTEMGPIPVIVS